MAVAELIGAAIGVLLLVIVAYVLMGSTLTAAETVANAQKDLTILNEARQGTTINVSDQRVYGNVVRFNLTNTGNEVISDFRHMDVFTYNNSIQGYQHYLYDRNNLGTKGNWTVTAFERDYVHPGQLDPGEKMRCEAVFIGINPVWLKVVTANGVYDSGYI